MGMKNVRNICSSTTSAVAASLIISLGDQLLYYTAVSRKRDRERKSADFINKKKVKHCSIAVSTISPHSLLLFIAIIAVVVSMSFCNLLSAAN